MRRLIAIIPRAVLLSLALTLTSTAVATAQDRGPTNTNTQDTRRNDGFDSGWLGLIGLAGLAGLMRRNGHMDGRQTDTATRAR